MKPNRFDFDLATVDADGIAEAQAVAGAGALTLDGALISGGVFTSSDGMGRRLGVLSAGNDSGITFTVVGTDSDGKALTEVVTGGTAAPETVETVGYFLTVSSVTASGAAAGNVSVGTVDEALSQTIPTNYVSDSGCSILVDITGTINFTIRETFDRFQREINVQSAQWSSISALAAKTADTKGVSTVGTTGIQFVVNSHSTAAEAQMYVSQPGRS